jgi:hypothetical protein
MGDQVLTATQLVTELREAHSPHAERIAAGLRDGGMRIEQPRAHVPATNLLDIYAVRREHLSQFSSEHGRALHRDVSELCARLASAVSHECDLVMIRTSVAGESYVVFRDATVGGVLGCCHVFSKTELSADAWDKLWRD